MLESFNIGARLARGRSYARSGQVLAIAVAEGRVTAKVQGSRPTPYDVTIQVKTLSEAEWAKVLDALGRQALFAAKLLAGEMPQDIEPVFEEVGALAVPRAAGRPDDRVLVPGLVEPLQAHRGGLLPAGRGVRPRPLPDLHAPGPEPRGPDDPAGSVGPAGRRRRRLGRGVAAAPRALDPEPAAFWEGCRRAELEEPCGAVEMPREPSALPRRLGGFPFWRGQSPFLDTIGAIYTKASPRGLDVYLGPATGESRSEPGPDPRSPG